MEYSWSSLLSTGENGLAATPVRTGGSLESLAMALSSEAAPKQPETPSKGSNGDDLSTAPTPGRSGKARQTINIKAELEKRQGGKTLVNLVVIGEETPY